MDGEYISDFELTKENLNFTFAGELWGLHCILDKINFVTTTLNVIYPPVAPFTNMV